MKKQFLFLSMLIPFLASAQITTFPYFEDFESGQGGWSSGTLNGQDSWVLGTPNFSVINQAAPGGSMSWYADTTDFGATEYSYVISPEFDFSGLNYPWIELDIWWDLVTDMDGAVLQSSVNGGGSWVNVGHHDDTEPIATNWYSQGFLSLGFPNGGAGLQQISHWSGDSLQGSQGWLTARHFLSGLAGESSVLFRFAWVNRGGNGNRPANNVAFDNVQIVEGPALDFSVDDVQQAGPCGGGFTGKALVTISNLGGGPGTITELNDGLGNTFPVTSTAVGALSSAVILVDLPLQDPGTTNMNIVVSDPGDLNPANDSFSASFNCNVIGGAPHCNDFESGNPNPWFPDPNGVNSTWVLDPPANNVINTPGGGLQSWTTTGPNGISNLDENSAIVSPFFDFAGNTNVGVDFQLFLDAENTWDGAVLQFSLDGGQTWQLAGTQGEGTNWFNFGALGAGTGAGGQNLEHWSGEFGFTGFGWSPSSNVFPQLDGQSNVLFRFAYLSDDFLATGGVGVDDFCVTGDEVVQIDTPDVVINEFNYTDFEGNQFDFIELKNNGNTVLDMSDCILSLFQNDESTSTLYAGTDFGDMPGTLGPGEYYLIGSVDGYAVDYDWFSEGSENILVDSAAIELQFRLSNGDLVVVDRVGYNNEAFLFEGVPISTSDSNSPFQTNLGFSRLPDGSDFNNNDIDFDLVCVTPGTENMFETDCNPFDTVDVAITNMVQLGPCGGGSNGETVVSVTFQNLGMSDVFIDQVTDNLGGVHTFFVILLPAFGTETASISIQLPNPGAISRTFTVTVADDANLANNSYEKTFNCENIEANGHTNDFEDEEDDVWYSYTASESPSWNHGENTDNVSINTPSPNQSGTKFWVTNEGGTYNSDESSSVVSHFLDFSSMTSPVIKFDKWVDLETDHDGVVMESSLDGGLTWETAGETGSGVNSYNIGSLPNGGAGQQNIEHWSGDGAQGTQGWEATVIPVPELAGQSNVLIRFAIHADGNVVNEGGFGFDNIEIIEIPVPSIVINEFNSVDARGEAYDFVELKNTGSIPADMGDFQVNFIKEVNGVISQYDTILAPPLAGILNPGEYYLIADTGSALFFPNILPLTASGGVLPDTGAIELVYTPAGIRADVVCYGDEVTGFTEGNAIEFVDPGNSFYRGAGFSRLVDGNDTDDNLADFAFRCYTPGYTNEVVDSVCYTPKLVINEFNYADPSGEAFDFVEIKNNEIEDIDLSNFDLVFTNPTNSTLFPLNGVLVPGDYFVVGAAGGVPNLDMSFALSPDYVAGEFNSIALLYQPTGEFADLAGNSGALGFEGASIPNLDEGNFLDYVVGFSRIPDGMDTDQNSTDFQMACHTPGEPNVLDIPCVSLMVINEVDKLGANGDSVYVELYNKTPILADLDGFILEFDDATNLDSIILDGTIGNQEYRVFSIASSGFDSDHVTIMLQDTQSTTIVDRLTIAQTPVGLPNTENEFATLDASNTLSISRIPDGQDTDDNGNDFELVCATLGSENFNDLSCDLVGIGEALQFEMKLYPNPASDFLTLETGIPDQFDIQILDGLGRIVMTTQISNRERIDISSFIPGVYSIIATDLNGKSAVGRFVKS